MSDDATIDPDTGLLLRAAFLKEVRQGFCDGTDLVRRGCLLILHFPVLEQLAESGGSDAANEALRNLLGVVETRLRSRDTLGRIGDHSLCILLRQCREQDAVLIAEQYAALLRDVVVIAGENRAPMDLYYRVVPLDWRGRRSRQGVSKIVKVPADAERIASAIQTLSNVGDKEPGQVLPIRGMPDTATQAKRQATPGRRSDSSAKVATAAYRLKPGMLLKHRPLVCCYRVRPVGIAAAKGSICDSALFDVVLQALSLRTPDSRPLIESQLIVPVDVRQLDSETAHWLKDECRTRRVAPSDVCLSMRMDLVTRDLRASLPALRALNRQGIRLMLEGVSSAAQFTAFQNLAGFDYLMISAKVLHASLTQVRARKELESLITLARTQQREVCATGIDSATLLTHAQALSIDIGFGRECGRSEPFPTTLAT